ncbi:MAG: SLC13 family permease [Pirellulales bacterium]|nr:SLC13 family permease [Pirellulales bacterium]
MPLLLSLGMSTQGWLSLLVVLGVFIALQLRRGTSTDLLFLGGLVAVVVLGVISPADALAGFANPAVPMIGALFIVTAGLRSTGVLDRVGQRLLGTATNAAAALTRLSLAVGGISAFVNNTPVVAMLVPVVIDWCRRRGVSPSRLLIPLSYLAIMGGTCTLIGTSTNLVVNGLLQETYQATQDNQTTANLYHVEPDQRDAFHQQLRGMTLFEIGQVGIPCTLAGALYLILVGRRRLPNRTELIERLEEQRREYLVELLVQPDCPLIGQTVQAAGLRRLRGLFLIEIDRADELITPVTPSDVIRAGDRLVFTGVVTTIVDLVKIPGLVPATDLAYELHPSHRQARRLTEAVISKSSPLIGSTVREAGFRQLYNAAVVAVHRNGARLPNKVGDIVLEPGDTLLLQTRHEFDARFRHNPDFYLVAGVAGSEPRRHERAWLATILVLGLVIWLSVWTSLGSGSMAGLAVASLAVAGLMILGRCLSHADARSAVDLQVLVTIAAALGLGRALTESGAAQAIATGLVHAVGSSHPYVLLASLYLLAVVFTELITNVAVAAMLFPLAVATAAASGLSPRPFIMAIALAASMSFLTPVGYQTNLMVLGPGGYHPRDYFRVGWPLLLIVTTLALILIPQIWPFAL